MPDTCPSRTALRVAQRRAAHQILDEPRLCDDPLALPILGLRPATYAHPDPAEQTPYERGLRAFLAVRSRFAEEALAAWNRILKAGPARKRAAGGGKAKLV